LTKVIVEKRKDMKDMKRVFRVIYLATVGSAVLAGIIFGVATQSAASLGPVEPTLGCVITAALFRFLDN